MMSEEGDAIENKLQEIASRLQHAAVNVQRQGGGDNDAKDGTNHSGGSASEPPPPSIPLKVTVAKPFKEDYQGYFVLTLAYHAKARHLDTDLVLSYAGVKGSTLKAQVWSGSTFQLLIPKYESEEFGDGSGGGGAKEHGRRRAKEELVLICLRLAFGLLALQALSLFIKHGDGDAYTSQHGAYDVDATPTHASGSDPNNDDDGGGGFTLRAYAMVVWLTDLLRQTVRHVVLNTWVVSF